MIAEFTFALLPLSYSLRQLSQIPNWPHFFPGRSPQPLAVIPRIDASLPSMVPAPSRSGPCPLSSCLHSSPRVHGALTMHRALFQGPAVGMRHLSHRSGPEGLFLGLCTHHAVPSAQPATPSGPFLPKNASSPFVAGFRGFSSFLNFMPGHFSDFTAPSSSFSHIYWGRPGRGQESPVFVFYSSCP